MSEPPSKRQRLSPNAQSTPPDGPSSAREALITSLLSERNDGSRKRALVEDLSDDGPSTRPKFDMPDLSGSSSLLARVQSFLPQLQQANSSLSATDGSAFELVEAQDDEDAEEHDYIQYTEVDETPLKEDEEPDPQIIIDLALGVLEERHPTSSSDESESDQEETSSEEEHSISDDGVHEASAAVGEGESRVSQPEVAGNGNDTAGSNQDASLKKPEFRKLIQELD